MRRSPLLVPVLVVLAVVVAGSLAWLATRERADVAPRPAPLAPAAADLAEQADRAAEPLAPPASERAPAEALTAPEPAAQEGPGELATEPGGALRVRLVYTDDGEPVPAGRVALTRGDALVCAESTDARGEALLAGWLDATHLSAAGPFRALVHRPLGELVLAIEAGEDEDLLPIEVERGVAVAGRVELDGAPPAKPLTLRLAAPDAAVLAAFDAAAGEPVFARERTLAVTTGAGGHFRFQGLVEGFGETLRVPRGLVVLASTDRVVAPATDHVLRLVTEPGIVGRVLTVAGTPVAGAHAEALTTCEDGGLASGVRRSTRTELDGRFWLPYGCSPPERVAITVRSETPSGHRELALLDLDVTRETDLGDVYLDAALDFELQVVDSAGAPVGGAVALASCAERRRSAPTDLEGRTRVTGLPLDCPELVVSARGFRPTTADLPPPVARPLRVVLEPATAIEVRVRTTDGARPPDELQVQVRSETLALRGGLAWLTAGAHSRSETAGTGLTGIGVTGLGEDGRPATVIASLGDDGVVLFDDLEPGLACEVVLVGRMEHVAHAWPPLVTERGRRILLETELDPAALEGAAIEGVVTCDGDPVEGAVVRYTAGGGGAFQTVRSDVFGRFATLATPAGTLTLLVRAEGYAPLRREELPRPSAGEVLRLELSRGRTALVHVRDAAGAPCAVENLRVEAPGLPWGAAGELGGTDELGEYVVRALVETDAEVVATLHDQRWSVPLPVGAPEATLVLPPVGTLVVRATLELERGTFLRLDGVVLASDGEPHVLRAYDRSMSDPAIEFSLERVRAGTWDLELAQRAVLGGPEPVLAARRGVVVRSGETTTVDLEAR